MFNIIHKTIKNSDSVKKLNYKGYSTLFDFSRLQRGSPKAAARFRTYATVDRDRRDHVANKKEGFVLVVSVLVLTTLLIVGTYLIASSDSENKISNAQNLATKNYYLAEAGINEMIWKIQNDPATGTAFTDGTLSFSHDISRVNVFGDSNASYIVAARNTVTSEAWITSTSTYQIGNHTSQRVIKAYVVRATGSNAEWEFGSFAGGRGSQQNGNFRFNGSGTALIANGARLHANQEFKVSKVEIIINDGGVSSSDVINEVAGGQITLNNSYQEAPTSTVGMLIIDFDSADPNSWFNRKTDLYTEDDFEDLPSGTILDGIIYVIGEAEIENKNFTINGVLVASEKIEIETDGHTVIVNAHETYGGGLLAKDDIEIDVKDGTITINGLIYAADDLDITSNGTAFTINGSMTGFDAEVTVTGGTPITLNYVPENFQAVIDPNNNPSSPLIQIDHWEEQY